MKSIKNIQFKEETDSELFSELNSNRNTIKTKMQLLFFVVGFLLLPFLSQAQLTGIKTIPGDYASLVLAVTDLNSVGVGIGGVTFNVAAGHTETLSGKIIMTATGTAANPIVFQKSGAGANPILTSYIGTVSTPSVVADGFWVLAGSDYVTIDGIDLMESGANTDATSVMEFGYGLFKASDADGCQHNVIKNCSITLNRLQNTAWTAPGHNGSTGIAILNGLYTATGAVTVTAASGSNSFNQIFSNTINNCNAGIVFVGYGDASPFTLGDTNNDIGGSMVGTGNTVLNFGGGGSSNPATGIFVNNQWGLNLSYNTINNNDGGGVNHASTLRGIFMNSSSTSASVDCTFNNITIHGGGTTSQVSFIENGFGSTPAGNTVNISNNTCTGDYLTATTGTFWGIYNNSATPSSLVIQNNTINGVSYSAAGLTGTGSLYPIYTTGSNSSMTINVSGNTINNISRTGTSGGTTIGIFISGGVTGMSVNVYFNTVSNMSIDGTGTSNTMYGIQTPTSTVVVESNIINNLQCLKTTGTSAMYGIYNAASPVDENYNNNEIHALLHSGTGIVYGLFANTATGIRTVSGNIIYNLSTGGTTIAGMNMSLSSPSVFKNKVYDIQSTSSGAPTVSGILLASTSTSGTANIYNNLIGDLKAPFANTTTAPTVRGINITGSSTTSNFNFSFNTVYLNASSAGTNFSTAAIYATGSTTATSGSLTLLNNIFVNNSTPAGTGLAVAFWRSNANLANYNSASNNNLYFAGTPSATNLIYYDGTNSDQLLADFKTRVAPADASSISENPTFVSTVGSNSSFLHINTGVGTQIESGGVTVTGITEDFDGDIRNISTPDIGADEFAGIGIDLSPPNISFTPLDNSCITGARTLVATITDASGVPISGLGLPVLYWSINNPAGPFTAATATSLGGDQYQFTLGAGSGVGDVIHYYIVAQDLVSPTPNIGASPSAGASGFSVNPPAVSTPPSTPESYTNLATLSGTYTVGASGADYPTLTAAIADYNIKCLVGPVVFALIDANYPSETIPIEINTNVGSNSTNTLTIRPANGNSATISGSSATCILRLNGADYVLIDGSNSGGTDRSLTIENISTSSNTAAICVSSLGTGQGATNNTIKNCNVLAGVGLNASNTFGIHVAGTTISTSATGNDNDNLTIQNNAISRASHGIYAQATSSGVNDNLNIIQNEIGSNTPGNTIGNRGILFSQAVNATIFQNTIFNMNMSTGSSTLRAIESGTGVTSSVISRNRIYEIANTATSVFRAGQGISVSSGTTTPNLTIANNMISGLKGDGSGTATNNSWGIMVLGGGGYDIYYNSINIPDNRLTTSSVDLSGGIYIASGVTLLNVKNNIVSVTGNPGNASSGKMYGIYSLSATAFNVSDFNNLYIVGNRHHVGLFSSTDRTLLTDWQTATGQDANSISANPQFLAANDLHINPAIPTLIESAGMPVAGILTDFDGDARNGTTPDIGADEGNFLTPLMNDVKATTFVFPTNGSSVGIGVLFSPQASFTNIGTAAQNNVPVRFKVIGPSPSMVVVQDVTANISSLAVNETSVVTFSNISVPAGGTYTIQAISELVGDQSLTNDTIIGTVTALPPLAGVYDIGASQAAPFNNLTNAINTMNQVGVSAAVTFALQNDYSSAGETFPLTINQIQGGSSSNTFTLKPASGVTAQISGSSTTCVLRVNGADYITIDGSNNGTSTRDLTFENTNPATTTAVICFTSTPTDGATNNTVKNTIAKGSGLTGTLAAIFSGSGTTIGGIAEQPNSDLTIMNNNTMKCQYGIAVAGNSGGQTGLVISQNEIGSNTATDYIGFRGIFVSNATGALVQGNDIFNIITTSTNPTGIYIAANVTGSLFDGNRVDEIRYTGTGGYGGKGIDINTGAPNSNLTISNNMISRLGGDGWNSLLGDAIVGIRIGATGGSTNTTGGVKLYYNSVNLTGSFAGNSSGTQSAALYISSTATNVDIRNNILATSLDNTAVATDKTWAINTAGSNTAFTNINFNDYYVSGAAGILGFLTSDRTTLLDWQSASGQDGSSMSQNPQFISDSDLHVNPAGTPVESGATPIAGVTQDFDGNVRNGTTPDIGADEGNFVLTDLVGPGISYSNLLNTICTNPISFNAQITDASGVNTTAGTKPRLWYKKSTEMNVLPATNTSADDGWKYVEASNASSPFTFTFDYSLLTSAITGGDVIEYFVVAQDLSAPPNVGTNLASYNSSPATVALGASAFPVSGTKSFTFISSPATITTIASTSSICINGDVNLSLGGDPATGAEYQWESSPAGANTWSPISGATASTYTATGVTASTDYRCVIKCGGTPIAASPSALATVTVSSPEVLTTTPGSECGPGPVSVSLEATASMGSTLNWYAAPTGGTAIGTSSPFNTPAISSTTTYYVAASEGGTSGGVGPLDPTIGTISSSNIAIGTQRMFFDVLTNVTIVSVDIFPTAAIGSNGSITIRDNTQTVIANVPYTTTVTGGSVQTVILNVALTPGTNYEIGQGTAIQLNRNTTGAVYPYNSAAINITGNTFDPVYYYFFYNWQWSSGCESARTPVTATILPLNTYYQDSDMDTYGNPAVSAMDCVAPLGYVLDNTDCDDTNANINPATVWYKDADNDGYSDGTTLTQCAQPVDYKLAINLTATSGDCDDTMASVYPGAPEICDNGIDDDCDGNIDETLVTWTGNGDGTTWTDNDNWDNGLVPQACNDIVIPGGSTVVVPGGSTVVGNTLQVDVSATFTVEPTAVMSIQF